MAEYLHELRPRSSTHFDRLGIISDVLAAMDDTQWDSPEERAAKFEALLKIRGYEVRQA